MADGGSNRNHTGIDLTEGRWSIVVHSAPAVTLVASPATASSVCMPLTATPPGASSTFTVTVPAETALTRIQVG